VNDPVRTRVRSAWLLAVFAGLVCAGASIPALLPRPTVDAVETEALTLAIPSPPVVVHLPSALPARTDNGLVDQIDPSLDPGMAVLGSWTVTYAVGPENGDGANIEIPLRRLDGVVIKPGATFDFWRAVGEVSRRTGYRPGGIIAGNHIEQTGAWQAGSARSRRRSSTRPREPDSGSSAGRATAATSRSIHWGSTRLWRRAIGLARRWRSGTTLQSPS
jgi:hypothetical protein